MSNTKRALEMLRELHIRGEHEWLDQEDIGTVIAALEADASPSASEPLPDGEILRRCGLPIHYAAIGKWTQAKAIAELRSILGRSEPTRTEVEREIADWLEQDSDCENEEEAAAQIRAGEYRLKGTP